MLRGSRRAQRGLNAERSALGHGLGDFRSSRLQLASGDDLLNEADPKRLRSIEAIAGEKPAHGVPPSSHLGKPNGGPAERKDSAIDLDLSEPRVLGAEPDVAGEHQLDPDGQAPSTRGEHERLLSLGLFHAQHVD